MGRPPKEVTYISGLKDAELAKELRKVSRLANDRLRALERAGIKTFSYKTAQNYAKTQGRSKAKPRFKSGAGMSYNQMEREYKQIVKFLGAETSTVSGMETAVSNMLEGFTRTEEEGGFGFDISGLNKRQLNRLWKTLSAGQWRDIQEAYGSVSSEDIIDSIISGVRDGMTIRELKKVLDTIENDMPDEYYDWADFDKRFTRWYANHLGHF